MKNGWKIKNLGNVCLIKTGKKDVNQGNPNGKYPFFTCAKKHTFSDTFSFDTEALLIAGNGDVGNVSYYNGKFEAYQRTYILSDFQDILPKFLFLILDGTLKPSMSNQKLGNTMPYIKLGMLTDFEIPLPPLPEQQRIVAVLDETFAAVATAKENAEKNLQNAKELFKSYLQAVFENKGEGWEEKRLEEICIKITDGVHKKPTYVPDGIPFIKINNLTDGSKISFENVSYITKEDHHLYCKRTNPEKGDILITKDGTIGVVRVIETDIEFSIFVSVALIKPKSKEITPFLKYVLISPLIQNQIKPKGAALKHLYLTDLRKITIPTPPLSEQLSIVRKLDALSTETERLETIYQQKINDLEELKISILQKAFNGELAEANV